MQFKSQLNLTEDRKINNLKLQHYEDNPDLVMPPLVPFESYHGDAKALLAQLQSFQENDILSAYKQFQEICSKNYDFPIEFLHVCLDHTLSTNPTIARTSQYFLTNLFSSHSSKSLFFNNFDLQTDEIPAYFEGILKSAFLGKTTSDFLISIFQEKKLRDELFSSQPFIDLLFSQIGTDPTTADFFGRLYFLQAFMGKFVENVQQYFLDCVINIIIHFFPKLDLLDQELVKIFIYLSSFCVNRSDSQLNIMFSTQYFPILISNYSNQNYPINFYIMCIICGLSGSSIEIASQLYEHDLIQFFGNFFKSCPNEEIQLLFVKITRNLVIYDNVDNFLFSNELISSQFFNDLLEIFSQASTKLKLKIAKLICTLAYRLKMNFIDCIINLNLIPYFVDFLYIDSDSIKVFVIKCLCAYSGIYIRTKDPKIMELLTNVDLVEAVDDYLNEFDNDFQNQQLTLALQLRDVLYEINDFNL
ncbi:hypothetical protein TRFO_35543 [Tritrichomonas foetus]|uniref:Uncharacterized protein n=1 Tax=Tritrichomonas foetus TaxID=1144522 RepID=A0A1J4JKN0_9EUKA|nr:hypothetical protein TRFO_35543 [Tritrichomonas foetus]|eukprot:OHS98117.1 hypothetical protein TRFO_35543 [Tritrichomonas foetus]